MIMMMMLSTPRKIVNNLALEAFRQMQSGFKEPQYDFRV